MNIDTSMISHAFVNQYPCLFNQNICAKFTLHILTSIPAGFSLEGLLKNSAIECMCDIDESKPEIY